MGGIPVALISSDGLCKELPLVQHPQPQIVPAKCEPGWARFTRTMVAPVFERALADETSELRLHERVVSRTGTLVDPRWDDARDRSFYGLAIDQPAELWMTSLDGNSTKIAGNGPWSPLDISTDGRFVLARREVAFTRAGLYLIEIATGNATALTDPAGLAVRGTFVGGDVLAIVERDDRRVLEWISTWWRARVELDGDVVDFAVLPQGIVAVVEVAGRSTLQLIDLATGHHRVISEAPDDGVIRDLQARSDAIAFTYSDATHPREVHAHRSDTFQPLARWPSERSEMPRPAIHEIIARDGVRSQLLAYLPTGDKLPVLLELHGGPEDRWLPTYDRFVQFATAEGYAVIRPNVRGSAGQGRTFMSLDDGAKREHVLRDVDATLAWIAAQPSLDASRVVVMGTSYGGYLGLASLRAFPDRLRGGITLGAVTDFVGLLEGTAPYRRDHRRAEYGDERDPATRQQLAARSPVAWVKDLKKPLLVAYGEKDPRVPPATATRFIESARAAGVPVWSIAAADEGHWFERTDNRRAFDVLAIQFLRFATR